MRARGLTYGDTIGIVAPAGCSSRNKIEKKIDILRQKGFQIKEGKHLYESWGYLAGRDEERVEDLMNFFQDPGVDMILCMRGGYGSTRIVDMLDYEMIKENPKIFLGFSDITVLLNAIYDRTGLITFHGPGLTSNLEHEDTYQSLILTLMKGYQPYQIHNPVQMKLHLQPACTVEGTLVGGNLCMICSTLGTPYEVQTKENILFIEDIAEPPYKVDRMLTQLLSAGKLQTCKGIILGQFTNCENKNGGGFTVEEVLRERLAPLHKPIMMNLAAGHDDPKLTLPIGAKIRINHENPCIEVIEPVIELKK